MNSEMNKNLLSNENEQKLHSQYRWLLQTLWKKPDPKEYTLPERIYITSKTKQTIVLEVRLVVTLSEWKGEYGEWGRPWGVLYVSSVFEN